MKFDKLLSSFTELCRCNPVFMQIGQGKGHVHVFVLASVSERKRLERKLQRETKYGFCGQYSFSVSGN